MVANTLRLFKVHRYGNMEREEPETTLPLLLHLFFTRKVIWAQPKLAQMCFFSSVTFHSFKSWLLYCFQALSKAGFHNLLFLICGVWPERNGLKVMRIWEHTEVTTSDVSFIK